jgi:hypothetical protein
MVMAAKLTRLTHKIAVQLHLVAKRYTTYSSRSRRQSGNFWIYPLYYTNITICKLYYICFILRVILVKDLTEYLLTYSYFESFDRFS